MREFINATTRALGIARRNPLLLTALFSALSSNGFAQSVNNTSGENNIKTEISNQGNDKGEKETQGISVHGTIQVGKIVIPDYADVASENAAALVSIDASHEKTGLGVSIVRIEDFSKDPANPVSQATVINPHWNKKFGNFNFSANSEIAFIDKMSEGNGVTAALVGSYDAGKGWNIDGTYFHGFNKGSDSDAIRLGITKNINDALSLTAQRWYKSDYDKNFFGRITVNVDLGNGFYGQFSCIAKDGNLTPTVLLGFNF